MITNSCRTTSKTARKLPSRDSSSDTPVWCIPPRAGWCAIRIWPKTSPKRYSCCWLGRRAGWEATQSFQRWLYRAARHVASETARREGRRRHREQLAVETMSQSTPDEAWRQIEPLLDEAMANLSTADHDAVVLRYFERPELERSGCGFGFQRGRSAETGRACPGAAADESHPTRGDGVGDRVGSRCHWWGGPVSACGTGGFGCFGIVSSSNW